MKLTIRSEEELQTHAASLLPRLGPGDVILLDGPLGAGKTTWARGLLWAAGWTEAVRSPTYNLMHLYATQPPILHADLYRLGSAEGIGLEDYLDAHLCVIEWPDRLGGLVDPASVWRITISFGSQASEREVEVLEPGQQPSRCD